MKTISIADAAEELNIREEELQRLCRNGTLELIGTEISKRSIAAFKCEPYEEPEVKPKSKGGRPPKVITYEEAAQMMNETWPDSCHDSSDIEFLAIDNILEPFEFPGTNDIGVTKRSVQAYISSYIHNTKEPHEPEQQRNDGPNNELDLVDNSGYQKEEVVYEEVDQVEPEKNDIIQVNEENPFVPFTDFTGIEDMEVPAIPKDEDLDTEKPITQKQKIELSDLDKPSKHENTGIKTASDDEFITIKKEDFTAALSIAQMRAELGVYRSLKSFERR